MLCLSLLLLSGPSPCWHGLQSLLEDYVFPRVNSFGGGRFTVSGVVVVVVVVVIVVVAALVVVFDV